ncbi:MAG: methyltransferase domain-containing protein [Rhodothermales bacterium]|nr:methyltransferase domain-containing protein [Rhodothermales bacterium]
MMSGPPVLSAPVLDRPHPPGVLPSVRTLPLVCPRCKGGLSAAEDGYRCAPCDRTYPLHAGIPDFRVFPDPFLSVEEDRARTDYVLGGLERCRDLRALLEHYWKASDITPEPLRARFVQSALRGENRARRVVEALRGGTFAAPVRPRAVLEVGSGTGNFLAVAPYRQVVGTDIGMRWLHVSRQRFRDKGLPVPPLVCCCAEHLPFPDGYFDLVVSTATLEFTRAPGRALAEAARALRPGGAAFIATANRYSLAQEPYAYLWGVGFLPRAWQARYVRWRRGASYEHIRLLSLPELRRLAAPHFAQMEVALPDIDDASLRGLPRFKQRQVYAYRALKSMPGVSGWLRAVAPQWDVKLTTRDAAA